MIKSRVLLKTYVNGLIIVNWLWILVKEGFLGRGGNSSSMEYLFSNLYLLLLGFLFLDLVGKCLNGGFNGLIFIVSGLIIYL